MPTSDYSKLSFIVKTIVKLNPQSVLDIGVGFGKYGFLAREYLELFKKGAKYNDWQHKIDGIEIFPEYLTPVHDFIYDNIYVGNVVEKLPEIKEDYDLILLIDVLEHLNENEGNQVLDYCLEKGRSVLVVTPKDIGNQGAEFNNEHETHVFQWKKRHFKRFPKKTFFPNKNALVCILGEIY